MAKPGLRSQLPLRLRLTAWYVSLLALTLLSFCGYLYLRLEQSLLAQLDAALVVAAAQAPFTSDGAWDTESLATDRVALEQLTGAGFGLRVIDATGQIVARYGPTEAPLRWPLVAGHATVETDQTRWRIYTQALSPPNNSSVGWLQVIQSLDPVQAALESLSRQMWLGFPLVLLLATGGGLFLARRALAPVDQITHTAAALSASDLSRRIGYHGPQDELGRLATTFDAMLERLAAAFGRERRFTADAAHELRTPLTALKGRIEVSLSRERSVDEYQETLRAMAYDVERLVRLSDDLLLLARLDHGELRPEPELIELDDLLASLVEQVRDLATARGVALDYPPTPGVQVRGDLSQLSRLLLNLLDNGLKFTPAGGRVQIELRAEGDWAWIMMSDTGIGIAAEHLAQLGQRFYRGAADRARSAGGSGLGLAIAGELARAHGGTLTLTSSPGAGTRVTVRLPLAPAR